MSKETVLSKFMISYWATFIANLGRMWPAGRRLDTLLRVCNGLTVYAPTPKFIC